MAKRDQPFKQRGWVPPPGGQGVREGQHETRNTKPINSLISVSAP